MEAMIKGQKRGERQNSKQNIERGNRIIYGGPFPPVKKKKDFRLLPGSKGAFSPR